jgi:hypothetical protein
LIRPNARLSAFLLAVCCFSACHNRDRVHVETDEGPPRMATMLAMSNERASAQLLEGFYNLEDHSWRWTAGHFSVLLRPPLYASDNGATLKVHLSVPKPVIDHVKTLSLTASVAGNQLTPETFTQPGEFTFVRDVPATLFPADALDEDTIRVDFSLDRFLAPGTLDPRELGIVVTSIGFEPRKAPPIPR